LRSRLGARLAQDKAIERRHRLAAFRAALPELMPELTREYYWTHLRAAGCTQVEILAILDACVPGCPRGCVLPA
jgi:hypothetical protein